MAARIHRLVTERALRTATGNSLCAACSHRSHLRPRRIDTRNETIVVVERARVVGRIGFVGWGVVFVARTFP